VLGHNGVSADQQESKTLLKKESGFDCALKLRKARHGDDTMIGVLALLLVGMDATILCAIPRLVPSIRFRSLKMTLKIFSDSEVVSAYSVQL
jgi:hypothetical protein